ncbi:methyltransferase [Niveomyces insectorum RCEF 264]|uniref:Methyltransferase n=1 Tax=Niveomyces insectorum RCEF 264 TaxID=1081102 RepID=A0A167PI64_9HYPO|nr:methyltransferase [Niveomyces insectorum RCEF 264]
MGRGGFRRNRGNNRWGGGRGGGGGGGRSTERYHKAYPEIVKANEQLERYYNGLLHFDANSADGADSADNASAVAERDAFWAAFRRELPHSFRFCGSKGHALAVQKLLQTRYIPALAQTAQTEDGLPVHPPQPVPWYPDNLAWWTTTPKTVIRKFPPFAAFQRFLVSETSVGNISRQEVVSMIPPLLLDVRPGMAVLDLCAAPGSKAAQLLEMVHQGEEARIRKVLQSMERLLEGKDGEVAQKDANNDNVDDDESDPAAQLAADPSDDGRATGVLIANDSDYKRSHLLIHQLKRLSSPNIIVTNHDATIYPALRLPPLPVAAEADTTTAAAVVDGKPRTTRPARYLKFDRILADVPCSGDGTLRKNVTLWKDWNPGNALGLHLVQVRILVRALQLLKPGGRVVYSTCSLNPIENEAVVHAAIAHCGRPGAVELVDSRDQLPQLQRRPGLTSWPVLDKAGRLWRSWTEVEAYMRADNGEDGGGDDTSTNNHSNNNNNNRERVAPSRVVPTMFPPTVETAARVPLERCMRVYPHLQDTGGFFIAVLEKKAEFKATTVGGTGINNTSSNGSSMKKTANGHNDDDAAARGTKRSGEASAEAEESQPAKKPKPDTAAFDAAPADEPVAKSEEALAVTAAAAAAAAADVDDAINDVADEGEEIVDEAAAADDGNSTSHGDNTQHAPRRKHHDGSYEEPFKYLATDHAVVTEIQAFYALSPRFPADRFLVRNAYGEPAKAIYYTSGLVRDILVSNTNGAGANAKFVHAGVRMFVKQEAPSAGVCRWRIQAEGLPLLQGYVGGARVVRLHRRATLRALLVEMFPRFGGPGGGKATDGAGSNDLPDLGEVGEQLPGLGMGCFVLKVEPDPAEQRTVAAGDGPLEPMALPLWKSFHSLNLMLPKEDRAAMLLRLFNDTTPLVNNALRDKNKPAATAAGAAAAAEPPSETASAGESVGTAEAVATPVDPTTAAGQTPSNEAEMNDYDAEDAPSS